MAKNLVICCDGTAGEYSDHNTNVVKIYSILERDPATQLAFYDPGVGTFSIHPALTKIARGFLKGLGLAFGLGITQNILDAYRYLMQNYEDGDQIFLFGFSRGAYTVRAVAAMIEKCGLLYPNNDNLLSYAAKIFKREADPEVFRGFKKTFARPVPIRFLGLWDTVSSVGWMWDPVSLPYTANNPSVEVVRHAISIDERRAFFRQNLWGKPKAGQDVKQVWFAGVHSDVGGGYASAESGLSKIALEWMVVEAFPKGLLIDPVRTQDVVMSAASPDHRGDIHNSLTLGWWPAELWPKVVYSWRKKRRKIRFNLGRRRYVDDRACVHQSALDRKQDVTEYRPPNFPGNASTEPWVRLASILPPSS